MFCFLLTSSRWIKLINSRVAVDTLRLVRVLKNPILLFQVMIKWNNITGATCKSKDGHTPALVSGFINFMCLGLFLSVGLWVWLIMETHFYTQACPPDHKDKPRGLRGTWSTYRRVLGTWGHGEVGTCGFGVGCVSVLIILTCAEWIINS